MKFLLEVLRLIASELVGLWLKDRKKPNDVTHVGPNKDRQKDIEREIDRQRR